MRGQRGRVHPVQRVCRLLVRLLTMHAAMIRLLLLLLLLPLNRALVRP